MAKAAPKFSDFKPDFHQSRALEGMESGEFKIIKAGPGTGKTTILRMYQDRLGNKLKVFTTSHRASAELRKKGVRKPALIQCLRFARTMNAILKSGITHIVIDEAGMSNDEDRCRIEKLARAGDIKVCWIGDDKQLGPVTLLDAAFKDDWFAHAEPHFTLIIDYRRKANATITAYNGLFGLEKFDILITSRNATCVDTNDLLHRHKHGEDAFNKTSKGDPSYKLHVGDMLICNETFDSEQLYNNGTYRITHILKNSNYEYEVRLEGVQNTVKLRKEWFKISFIREAKKSKNREDKESKTTIPFELAYCITVHAAQGGQWAKVGFILDAEVDQRLFYTATTRAEEETVIFDENNLLSILDLTLPYETPQKTRPDISTEEQERDELAEVVEADEDDLAEYEAAFADVWGAEAQAPSALPKPTHVPQSPPQAKAYVNLDFDDDDLDRYLPAKSQLTGIYDSSAHKSGWHRGLS